MADSSESLREFENVFPSFNNADVEYFTQSKHQINISERFEKKLVYHINDLLERHEQEYVIDWKDPSIYTGTTGVALMYLHLYTNYITTSKRAREDYLKKAVSIMQGTLKILKGRSISFLTGDAGPLAVAAVVFKLSRLEEESDECIRKLFSICKKVDLDSPEPNELLFGKVGLLYSLLFLNNNINNSTVPEDMIAKLCKVILKSGKHLGRNTSLPCPLMYEWHGKKYLGAAHGICGILYILLNLQHVDYVSRHLDRHIQATIDFIISLQYPSGNFPSSISSKSDDKLVQWCHGAPGCLYMLLAANEVFSGESYLKAAKACGKVVWERGLLKKGYGICHGVAGNAYTFLALYNATKNPKYLYYAGKFAEWCMDYGKHGCRIADRPCSLFEGMAGTIYFLVDMLNPTEAKFPAFQL